MKRQRKKLISDLLFKEIYGTHKEFLKDFLDSFFSYLKKDYFYEQEVLYDEVPLKKFKQKDKGFRGDVLLVLPQMYISIEAFSKLTLAGIKKTLSYITRIYSTQMKEKNKDYMNLRKVVAIVIADEVSEQLKLEDTWFQEYKLRNTEKEELTEDIEFYILRLDKVKKIPYNEGESNKLILHLKLMGARSHKERKQIGRNDEILMTIAEHMVNFMNDRETNQIYSIENKLRNLGKEEGLEEGKKEGKELYKKEIVTNMLQNHYTSEEIMNITGLSKEELEKIKEKQL